MNHDSPSEIRRELERLGLRLQKRWGQNFLVNPAARQRIVELLQPQPGERIWEIGPGLGALTELLLPRVGRLVVFEIDHGLIGYLRERFGGEPRFELEAGDALKRWRGLYAQQPPDGVIGNLPYSSASALVGAFAEERVRASRLVFTVQKELARRMGAAPGSKDYSSFSVLCQSAFRVRECFDLRAGSFFPAPAVVSTVVELRPLSAEQPAEQPAAEWAFFLRTLRALFRSRRKTIRNNLLAAGLGDEERLREALRRAGVEPGQRAEELEPEGLRRLAAELGRLQDL